MDLSKFGVDVKEDKPLEVTDSKLQVDMEKIKKDFSQDEIERFLPWFLKYKVEKFDDLILTSEIKQIIDYIENFKPGKAIMLYGMPGCGKTTTLTLLGEKYGYEIFEMNASDARNKKSIIESVGDVIKQRSLFAEKKLILIDEVDGVSGNSDRGGMAEISKIVKECKYPIVFAANDGESDKVKPIKKVAKFINFENHSKEILNGIALRIFEGEGIEYEREELDSFIDERNSPDIRGFINDLQASVSEKRFVVGDVGLEIRDYKKKIERLLDKIYFSYPEDSYKGSFNSDINLDELMLYLEENTPAVLQGNDFIQAFNELAKADLFKGRIMKYQYWRYLVYINFYMTYGVSSSKQNPKKVPYKRNGRILKKWINGNSVLGLRARTKVEKKKDEDLRFIERLAKVYGRSALRTRKEDILYFKFTYDNSSKFRDAMDNQFEIGDDVKKGLDRLKND